MNKIEVKSRLPRQYDYASLYEILSRVERFTESFIQTEVTYNPANLADGARAETDVTINGAAPGDFALASFSVDTQGIDLHAQVTAANTATVVFQNETGGAIDLASGTLRVLVIRR